jgi:predicted nucleotidyltransferase
VSVVQPVLQSLNSAGVRFVVVGGVAVVLHGHPRFTADLDLIVDLEERAALAAIDALAGLGLQPRAPVDARMFANPETRRGWVEQKGMRVFTMWDPADPLREVDLFVDHPIPFDELWSRAELITLSFGAVRVASIPDLIALKRLAGRPEDHLDIEALEAIEQERRRG